MLLTKTVLLKTLNNVKYFKDRGYHIPPIKNNRGRDTFGNSIIEVKVEDLPTGSHAPVCVRCDGCGKNLDPMPWRNYKRYVHEDGKYYCTKCKKKCMKYISFKQDSFKKELALKNGIEKDNYIVIDCRKSDLKFIKNSIINSELANLFDLSQIDWQKCHEFACRSLLKPTCDLCNDGFKTLEISNKLKISVSTVRTYLKQGNELNLCSYIPRAFRIKEEIIEEDAMRKKVRIEIETNMLVICFTTGEVFNSAAGAGKQMKTDSSCISKCCKNNRSSAGKHSKTGEPLTWMYYVDYLNLTPKEIQERKQEILIQASLIGTCVICLNTKKVFRTIKIAGEYYNMKSDAGIRACCSGQVKYADKNPETGEPLIWMYYDEYMIKNQTLGWYDDFISNYNYAGSNVKKIICLTTKEIFNSQFEAGNKHNMKKSGHISDCCNHKCESAGKHQITGEPLKWMFYDEYLELNNEPIKDLMKSNELEPSLLVKKLK